jgi:hypothetical protein
MNGEKLVIKVKARKNGKKQSIKKSKIKSDLEKKII